MLYSPTHYSMEPCILRLQEITSLPSSLTLKEPPFLSVSLVLSVFSSSLSLSCIFEIDPETLWTNKMHWKAMIKGTNTMFFVLTWEKKGHAAENKVVEKGQR